MRGVLHIDMNAFYCACHAAADPDRYQGLPTAVAGSPETRHGVVVTASYEARRRGVRATMTVAEALRACPELTLIAPDFDLYRDFSRRVFTVVRNYTPQVEVFSIDECWADVTGSRQFGSAVEIARKIQTRIYEELGLPSSVGVAPNKFLAKMASDLKKPMGLTQITLDSVPELLWPLPVESMFGVGGKSGERLRRLGIHTIGHLANAREELLQRYLGRRGPELRRLANGLDDAPVESLPDPLKSVGHSITLAVDTDSPDELATVLLNLSDQVGRRVRSHKMLGRTVQLTVRYGNRETITRSHTLSMPTDLTEDIYREARELLTIHRRRGAKVRLLGVALQNLTPQGDATTTVGVENPSSQQLELPLFEGEQPENLGQRRSTGHGGAAEKGTPHRASEADRERLARLTKVTDALRDKYGENALVRGRMLRSHPSEQIRDRKARGTSLQKDTLEAPDEPQ